MANCDCGNFPVTGVPGIDCWGACCPTICPPVCACSGQLQFTFYCGSDNLYVPGGADGDCCGGYAGGCTYYWMGGWYPVTDTCNDGCEGEDGSVACYCIEPPTIGDEFDGQGGWGFCAPVSTSPGSASTSEFPSGCDPIGEIDCDELASAIPFMAHGSLFVEPISNKLDQEKTISSWSLSPDWPHEEEESTSYGLNDVPGLPDFSNSYMLDTSTDFVSRLDVSSSTGGGSSQGPGCSIPCDDVTVNLSFDGCCFLTSSECDITVVGDGEITGPTSVTGPGDCGPMQVIVNGQYLPINVSDGDSVTVTVTSAESCCACHLGEITCAGSSLRSSGPIWSLSNGKLRLNKRKYLAQRNHIIRYRVYQKLKKIRKNRNTN